ncbi:MAG: phosphoribosylaminoimidazolesuccinocarboxamide synthase [Actinomycetota bacterium]
MDTPTITSLDLPLARRSSGKVRESWPLPRGQRLLATTDRFSAMDRVVGAVAHKGQVLNRLAAWWFGRSADLVDHHLVDVPDPNCSIVRNVTPLPVEVVVRGHITGSTSTSLWTMYERGARHLYGHHLPDGLHQHEQLAAPLITPTTKAGGGAHDEPITVNDVVAFGLVDPLTWERVLDVALRLFERGTKLAEEVGLILADTKYEFGLDAQGRLLLIDEVHTPDSSRYWVADSFERRLAAGEQPESHDKEPVRLALRAAGFTGDGEVPELPAELWAETSRRYVELFESLTGESIEPVTTSIEDRITTNLAAAGLLAVATTDQQGAS